VRCRRRHRRNRHLHRVAFLALKARRRKANGACRRKEIGMPKYLVHASYTAEGAQGLLKSGGTARRKAVEELIAPLGGKLEAFYFTFGDDDAILIIDLPDQVAASAIGLAVCASGTIRSRSTVLITPEEVDEAAKRGIRFRPPGE
jgi:uncharacterized protein with GYD domain